MRCRRSLPSALLLVGLMSCLAAFAAPALAQSPPTALEAHTNGSGSIDVTWTAVSGVDSYNVYKYTTSGGPYGTAYNVANTASHKYFNGTTDTSTYYFVVTSVTATAESAKSSQVSARSGTAQLPSPANVTAASSNGQVALSWNSVAGASSYDLYRTPNSPANDSGLFVMHVTGTSYTDTGLTNGTTYTYQVAAVAATGEGNLSGPAVATPLAPPSLTATVEATAQSGSEIDLAWTASTGATSYSLYRSTTGGRRGNTAYQSGLTGTTYNDTGLTNGTTYYYQIVAVAGGSQSAKSSEVSATTGSTLLSAPTLTAMGQRRCVFGLEQHQRSGLLRISTARPTPTVRAYTCG